MDPTLLTKLLQSFIDVFVAGQTRLVPDALLLLKALAIIELSMLGLGYALHREFDLASLTWKVVAVAVLAALITQWPTLTRSLIRAFMVAGLKAGGDAISETDMTDPGNIALYGLSVTAVIFQHLNEYTGIQAMYNITEILFSGWAALFVVLAYFALAIWTFIVLLEFYAFSAFGVILIPFALNRHLVFLAEKTIGAIFASAVQVLALSFVTSAALPIMVRLQTGINPKLRDVMVLLLGSLALLALAWRAHKIANAVIQGTPQLTIQDATHVVQTVVRSVQTVGTGAHALRQGMANTMRRRA